MYRIEDPDIEMLTPEEWDRMVRARCRENTGLELDVFRSKYLSGELDPCDSSVARTAILDPTLAQRKGPPKKA